MAITPAVLSSAITATQLQFSIQSVSTNQSGLPIIGAPPLPVGNPMFIDGECMLAIQQPVAGSVVVRLRGYDGTPATAHDVLSQVSVSATASDFGAIAAGQTTTLDMTGDMPISIGTDGTLTLPVSFSRKEK